MEKKLVVLTAMFALTAGLVFAQTMKNSGDEMAGDMEVTENSMMNDENMEINGEVNGEMNAEMNADMNEVPVEAPAEVPAEEPTQY